MPVNVSGETGSEPVKEMTRLMEYSVGEIMMNVNSLTKDVCGLMQFVCRVGRSPW